MDTMAKKIKIVGFAFWSLFILVYYITYLLCTRGGVCLRLPF